MGKLEQLVLDKENIPAHIAIIMDGNGRWAQKRLMAKKAGHAAGAQALKRLATEAETLGVQILTVYAFSTENWKRTPKEVDGLMDLMRDYIRQYQEDSAKNNMRLSVIGQRGRLPNDLALQIERLQETTKNKTGLHLVIALDYGARDEITRTIKKMCEAVCAGTLSVNAIDEETVAAYLDTAQLPDPELLIRTSGEMRLSNFLLWQLAYTELVFSEKLWPDFGVQDLKEAIATYQQRNRRFGGR